MVITQDEAHATKPVTLSRPNHLHVGQHWVQDYTVGGVRSVSRNRVTGRCGPGASSSSQTRPSAARTPAPTAT